MLLPSRFRMTKPSVDIGFRPVMTFLGRAIEVKNTEVIVPPGTVRIDVLEITGKTVISTISNENNTVLDMSHLNNGIYFIQISNNDNLKTVKLVKR